MRKRVYKYKDRREYHRQWEAKRTAAGICRCGKKSSCGVHCDECRERRRKRNEAARRAAGVPMKDPLGCNWLRPGDAFESKTSVILRVTRIADQVVHFTRNGFVKTSPLEIFCHAVRNRYTKITP